MNWFSLKQKPYLKYQQLNDQLLSLRYQYYTNNSVDIRLQINNLEIKISKLLEKYFKQYDEELKPTNIEKLPRIDNNISQQTFIKRTKQKISWGTSDKDEIISKPEIKFLFKLNKKDYWLTIESLGTEVKRYEVKKVRVKKNSNSIRFYKDENKVEKNILNNLIILNSDNKSTIVARKENDEWKYKTTNVIILKKILKFIEKYKL